jgi:valyl-tRNA synthetase
MKGYRTLWQMGTDHAGISTQLVVQEQLAAKQIDYMELGRDKFVDQVWQWKEKSGGTITRQLRRLGASLHWDTERFTLDEGLSRAVLEVFVRLHEEGLIYRGKRLVNWDPILQTSLSDLEVVSEEENGSLWHFKYPLTDSPDEYLVVATTRPETMLGDTAVAVHPDDERFKHLVGKTVTLPIAGRQIPIIADQYVDREFGSGCVKITPAHDFNDNEIGIRHNLPLINILNSDASLNDEVPDPYRGLNRFTAREKIVDDMQQRGLLEKIEDHKLPVPRGERSNEIVEPYLSDQWYVKTGPLAEPAIKAVEDGDIEFYPKNYANNYYSWMRDIQDWCISRQQWWGHRIPAWYGDDGNVYVGRNVAEIREKHGLSADVSLKQDDDVLDTWFSSALWTFSTLGWPDETADLATFHPTDVMVTGHDIITFWVSRMIMMTLKFRNEVPFRKVYVTGLVTDAEGQKMSKSKGNGLDPLDIIDGIELEDLVRKRTEGLVQPRMAGRIEKATRKEFPDGIASHGTDALRFTFYAIATSSRTIRFDMSRVEGYRNFCNKLWNAASYVTMNAEDYWNTPDLLDGEKEVTVIDRWIKAEFSRTVSAVTLAMETSRFDLAARAIYEFVWDIFCDWYLELTKPLLTSEHTGGAIKRATRHTLVSTLEAMLRLAHPFMPFITEEIWQTLPETFRGKGDSIMLARFPEADEAVDQEALDDVQWLKDVVTGVRNIRGEMDISPAKPIPIKFYNGNATDRQRLSRHQDLIQFLIRPESIEWLEADSEIPVAATHLIGDMQLLVPMQGLIDKDAEIARLDKEIQRLEKDTTRTEGKINNPNFVNKAPAEVVQKERDKLTDLVSALEQLQIQKGRIDSL